MVVRKKNKKTQGLNKVPRQKHEAQIEHSRLEKLFIASGKLKADGRSRRKENIFPTINDHRSRARQCHITPRLRISFCNLRTAIKQQAAIQFSPTPSTHRGCGD